VNTAQRATRTQRRTKVYTTAYYKILDCQKRCGKLNKQTNTQTELWLASGTIVQNSVS